MTRSIELPAPAEEVWQLVMDPRRLGEWVSIHRSVDGAPPAPLREHSSFSQKLALGGRSFDVTWTVSEATEPLRAVWTGSGPAGSRAKVVYDLKPLDGRTRFEYRNEFELPGGRLGAVAGRLVGGRLIRREADRSLARLERLLSRRAS